MQLYTQIYTTLMGLGWVQLLWKPSLFHCDSKTGLQACPDAVCSVDTTLPTYQQHQAGSCSQCGVYRFVYGVMCMCLHACTCICVVVGMWVCVIRV